MDKWINAPFTLRIKVVITLLTGIGSLILAAILFPVSHDRILIILSGMIFGFCLCRSIDILLLILRGSYEAITGTCTAVSPQPLRRYRKIALVDTHGAEIILLLGKQLKIKPGNCYCFYFRKTSFPRLGSEYLDAALATDLFLGYNSGLPDKNVEKEQIPAE